MICSHYFLPHPETKPRRPDDPFRHFADDLPVHLDPDAPSLPLLALRRDVVNLYEALAVLGLRKEGREVTAGANLKSRFDFNFQLLSTVHCTVRATSKVSSNYRYSIKLKNTVFVFEILI